MALCTPVSHSKLSLHSSKPLCTQRPTNGQINPRCRPMASSSSSSQVSDNKGVSVTAFEEGQLERPRWTGETPLSRFVGTLISFKPLYSVLKLGARQVLIRSVGPHLKCMLVNMDTIASEFCGINGIYNEKHIRIRMSIEQAMCVILKKTIIWIKLWN